MNRRVIIPIILLALIGCSPKVYKQKNTGEYYIINTTKIKNKQQSILYGTVRDKETNNYISHCAVSVNDIEKGTFTDSNGYFEITLPAGNYILSVQHVGHTTLDTKKIRVNSNTKTEIIFLLGKTTIY